jgi:hypothetical protein
MRCRMLLNSWIERRPGAAGGQGQTSLARPSNLV